MKEVQEKLLPGELGVSLDPNYEGRRMKYERDVRLGRNGGSMVSFITHPSAL